MWCAQQSNSTNTISLIPLWFIISTVLMYIRFYYIVDMDYYVLMYFNSTAQPKLASGSSLSCTKPLSLTKAPANLRIMFAVKPMRNVQRLWLTVVFILYSTLHLYQEWSDWKVVWPSLWALPKCCQSSHADPICLRHARLPCWCLVSSQRSGGDFWGSQQKHKFTTEYLSLFLCSQRKHNENTHKFLHWLMISTLWVIFVPKNTPTLNTYIVSET
jgi:hypothetical protein